MTKEQLKASVQLSLESSSSRMSALASNEMNFGRFISADEVISEIEAVTVKGLQTLANKIFQPDKLAVTLLGDLKGFKLKQFNKIPASKYIHENCYLKRGESTCYLSPRQAKAQRRFSPKERRHSCLHPS